MVKVEHSVGSARPVAEVFAALTDFKNTLHWQPAVIEEKTLTNGPIQVDTQIFQARTFMGNRGESTSVVCEFETNRGMVNSSAPEVSPNVRTAYRLSPATEVGTLPSVSRSSIKGCFA